MSGDVTVGALQRLSYMPNQANKDGGNLIAGQDYYNVLFTGGNISNVTLTNCTITLDAINNTPIGATTPSTGAFTTLSVSGTVSGNGFVALQASPNPIGSTTPNTGAFTTLASGAHTITNSTANSFSVGANGSTNPVLNIDSSVASQVSGITIQGQASGTAPTITTTDTAANAGLLIQTKGTSTLTLAGGSGGFSGTVALATNGSATRLVQTAYATTFTPGASQSVTHFVFTGPADGGSTAGTEHVNVFFNTSASRQWTGGTTVALQRETRFAQPTYTATSATTFTEAANFAIDGAPIQGTNATLTQTEALRVIGGAVGSAGTAYGLWCVAPTGASNNYAAGFSGNVSISGSTTGYAFNVVQAGTNAAYFGSTGANNIAIIIDNAAGGHEVDLTLSDAGTQKWSVLKNTSNQFLIYDRAGSASFLTAVSGGSLSLGSLQTFSINQLGQVTQYGPNAGTAMLISNTSGTASYTAMQFFTNGGGTVVGSISVSSTATAYNTTSDKRLKSNVQPLVNTGAIIDAIQPVTYNWQFLAGNPSGTGFLAQDLYAVYPDAVTVGDNGTVDVNGNVEQQWSVDYSKLVAPLLSEVQALRKRVAVLETAANITTTVN
ncbi:unnamed protein product [Sphagnum balticum]